MWSDSDKFDHLIALAAMKCAEEDAQALRDMDAKTVSFDELYCRKRSKMIRKHKRIPHSRSTFKAVVVRVAVAIVITLALAALLAGCVTALRQAIYDAIVEYYDEYFAIRYEISDVQEKETGYVEESVTQTEAEIIVPTFIEKIRKPTSLPEGAWEDEIINKNTKISVDYYVGEEYLFSFTQFLLNPSDKYVDNEDSIVTYMSVNGNDATIVEYEEKKEKIILWSDGKYSYQIFSTELSIEELLEYAKSVK